MPQLVTRAPGYLLQVALGQVDRDRFEALVASGYGAGRRKRRGGRGCPARRARALARTPLADFRYQPFAQTEIARLEELRLVALESRIEIDLAAGLAAELVGELEALVGAHPLRERFRGQLMLALYRAGRQAQALAVYQDARRTLVEELGIEPSPSSSASSGRSSGRSRSSTHLGATSPRPRRPQATGRGRRGRR